MKTTKREIMNKWNTSKIKEAFGIRLNYKNWEEMYNQRSEIIGGILYRERKLAMMFQFFKKGKEKRIIPSTVEEIYQRQNLTKEEEKEINNVICEREELTLKELKKGIEVIEFNYMGWGV